MKNKTEGQPHDKRHGWLKNDNPPGDFTKAARCGAKTRKGTPCLCPAMKNGRCRLHGCKSTGAPKGNRNALKHGYYSKGAIERRRQLRQLIKASRELMERVE